MKVYLHVFLGIVVLSSLLLSGCSGNSSTSPTAMMSDNGTGQIEGQLVADTGTPIAKQSSIPSQHADDATGTVYPLSGVTVQLIQNGTVITTTSTDEYGRFQFTSRVPGEYDVRVSSDSEAIAHYHISVNPDQTTTVYGRALSGDWHWEHEAGPHWNDMPEGHHWGAGFHGESPGPGYWHDGHHWQEPHETGPHHGPHHGE